MKSLYESILGSNRSDLKSTIEDWCDKNLKKWCFASKYEVNNKFQIEPEGRTFGLLFDSYDELPDYIKFIPNTLYEVYLGGDDKTDFKSFKGIPDKMRELHIDGRQSKVLPTIDAEVGINIGGRVRIEGYFKKVEKCNIKIDGPRTEGQPSMATPYLSLDVNCNIDNLHISGAQCIGLTNGRRDYDMGKRLQKILGYSDAPVNYYDIQDRILLLSDGTEKIIKSEPLTDKGIKKLLDFMGGVELDGVDEIDIDRNQKLIFQNNTWYRVKDYNYSK